MFCVRSWKWRGRISLAYASATHMSISDSGRECVHMYTVLGGQKQECFWLNGRMVPGVYIPGYMTPSLFGTEVGQRRPCETETDRSMRVLRDGDGRTWSLNRPCR